MKIEFLSKRSPHQILGVSSFSTASQIRSAYMKRIEVLDDYRYDQTTHPLEWQVVNEIRQELINAYAELYSPLLDTTIPAKLAPPSQAKPRPAKVENGMSAPVSMGNF
jgi:hypothetical protein